MIEPDKNQLLALLQQHLTPERMLKIDSVLSMRTRYLTVVLEDIYQPQNASAVLRTCECLGIQDIHIIENRNRYEVNPLVVHGSDKWLSLHKYHQPDKNSTEDAIQSLRKNGYRIVATTPHTQDVAIDEFDLQKGPAALFFGTERTGLSETVLAQADEFVKIPMVGYTESLNLSVSVAMVLYDLTRRLRTNPINWSLSTAEQAELRLEWTKLSIRSSDDLIKYYTNILTS